MGHTLRVQYQCLLRADWLWLYPGLLATPAVLLALLSVDLSRSLGPGAGAFYWGKIVLSEWQGLSSSWAQCLAQSADWLCIAFCGKQNLLNCPMGQCSTGSAALLALCLAYSVQLALPWWVVACLFAACTIVFPAWEHFAESAVSRAQNAQSRHLSPVYLMLCSRVDKAERMWLCLVLHVPAHVLWSAYSVLGRTPWAGFMLWMAPHTGTLWLTGALSRKFRYSYFDIW